MRKKIIPDSEFFDPDKTANGAGYNSHDANGGGANGPSGDGRGPGFAAGVYVHVPTAAEKAAERAAKWNAHKAEYQMSEKDAGTESDAETDVESVAETDADKQSEAKSPYEDKTEPKPGQAQGKSEAKDKKWISKWAEKRAAKKAAKKAEKHGYTGFSFHAEEHAPTEKESDMSRAAKLKRFVKKNAFRVVYVLVLAIMAYTVMFLYSYVDTGIIDVSFYQIVSNKVSNNIRIVQISDLHDRTFGENNAYLVDKVRSLKPDIIVMTGDMVTRRSYVDFEPLYALCRDFVGIAPTYFSCGNHEYAILLFEKQLGWSLDRVAETGVTVLNRNYITTRVGTTDIDIGSFYRNAAGFEDDSNLLGIIEKFSQSDRLKIALMHEPNLFVDYMAYKYDVDIVFSGHAHGGQVILPIVGGVYAPDQGIMPKYTQGMMSFGDTKLVVSRGLGNIYPIPRVNNNPEIVVTDIDWY